MKNPHYIGFNVPDEKLEELPEEALMTIIRREAHLLDLTLQVSAPEKYSVERQKSLQNKLKVYADKYEVADKPDYQWAAMMVELYGEALAQGENFSYPKEKRQRVEIPESEFKKLIMSRRSVRKFTDEPIEDEIIEKIINCANWAPTNCGIQAIRYIVIKDAAIREKMRRTREPYTMAVIADLRFYPDGDIECPYHDSGAAIQNLLLAFHYYGLGACYVSDTGINCDVNREALKLKEYEKITALIWFGNCESVPIAPARRNVEEIIEYL